MNTDFRPELITKGITRCLRSECPRAATCLRHLAYKYAEDFSAQHSYFDPRREAIGERCPDYLSNRVQLMARGFRRSVRRLSYGDVTAFRSRLRYELSCSQGSYYNFASGKRLLNQEDQEIVRAVFAEFGVETPELFDSYEEAYDLSF